MGNFYDPTAEHISKIGGSWCASFSGGKDSTALVTWVEWMRRAGWVECQNPQLVQSDTTVEHPALAGVSCDLMDLLRRCGWECAIATPLPHEKLYNRILGLGLTPIHPGIRNMRWCTRSTKIGPMDRWRKEHSSGLTLAGLRMGESSMRDDKILKAASGCAAGGECGIPPPSSRTYSPLLDWRTCQVIDWLNGAVGKEVRDLMGDVFAITRRLVAVYDFATAETLFEERQVVSAARFGCTGCPAIGAEAHAPTAVIKRYGADHPVCELYDVWFEARQRANRCYRSAERKGNAKGGNRQLFKRGGYGPIRLEVRKRLFARVMDIQQRAGIVLVSPEDEAFIRQCWAEKRYPRGWSEEDESVQPPPLPLFPNESCL
jgi:3'-phosphoadenosine 5'-phosphosulfate sulfotransferase (PAPS reductase)/FAD synthetase